MNQTERPTKITPPIIGRVHSIRTSEIIPMPNNPFQIRDDPSMCELIESISQQGILAPIEVRHLQSGSMKSFPGLEGTMQPSLLVLTSSQQSFLI